MGLKDETQCRDNEPPSHHAVLWQESTDLFHSLHHRPYSPCSICDVHRVIAHRSRGSAPRPAHSLRDTRPELVHYGEWIVPGYGEWIVPNLRIPWKRRRSSLPYIAVGTCEILNGIDWDYRRETSGDVTATAW
ncbi:unnamed protein product [Pleuronectes platessa]|uniref:Uncharacterized protein n=1 Tax=Pleuronectes platessa TaxID=8262 RepID=A0A9N7TVT7_PLEPL|nr:unnamed protein product [Pleuronectes platessa]